MAAAIVASDLAKTYPKMRRPALDGVDLSVERGEILGLLGPNGAGKTTLVKLICGVTRPSGGQLTVLGRAPTADGGRVKNSVAAVHQSAPFDQMLPVIDNLKIAAAFRGLRWSAVRDRAEAMLAEFGVADRAGQLAFTLSGGEQRRVQVVRALLKVPEVLLLDEPSAGLDVSGRRHVWDLITSLVVEHGTTVVWTSHYTEELERHCTRVLVLDAGRVIRHAAPSALVAEYGRSLVTVVLDDAAEAERVRTLLHRDPDVRVRVVPAGVELSGPATNERLPRLLASVHGAGVVPRAVEFHAPSLEDAFVALVGSTAGGTEG